MTPLAFGGLGAPELLIILAVVLLLFGGSRLAGLGKSSGRALREFKEETKGLGKDDKKGVSGQTGQPGQTTTTAQGTTIEQPEPIAPTDPGYVQPPRSNVSDGSDVRRDA